MPLKKLKIQFEKQYDQSIVVISGSTSKLYAQITNGAPYDILLSADYTTAQKLIENTLAVAESEFIYAEGKLVLWQWGGTQSNSEMSSHLANLNFQHLAIANPKLAPYGRAAIETLNNLNLYDKLRSKIVYGDNVAQAFQFIYSGSAELGFVALSQLKQIKQIGKYWEVPIDLYQPIKQSAVLLNRAKENIVAIKFLRFLKSPQVQQLISSEYGYSSTIFKMPAERANH